MNTKKYLIVLMALLVVSALILSACAAPATPEEAAPMEEEAPVEEESPMEEEAAPAEGEPLTLAGCPRMAEGGAVGGPATQEQGKVHKILCAATSHVKDAPVA